MSRRAVVLILMLGASMGSAWLVRASLAQQDTAAHGAARFTFIDVFLDCGEHRLAAYQIEIHDACGRASIVGIEGSGGEAGVGEGGPFADPPYYDPAAMMSDRVIIAALSTDAAERLPTGRTRIARLHLRLSGDAEPEFVFKLHAATGPNAAPIPAQVSLIRGDLP